MASKSNKSENNDPANKAPELGQGTARRSRVSLKKNTPPIVQTDATTTKASEPLKQPSPPAPPFGAGPADSSLVVLDPPPLGPLPEPERGGVGERVDLRKRVEGGEAVEPGEEVIVVPPLIGSPPGKPVAGPGQNQSWRLIIYCVLILVTFIAIFVAIYHHYKTINDYTTRDNNFIENNEGLSNKIGEDNTIIDNKASQDSVNTDNYFGDKIYNNDNIALLNEMPIQADSIIFYNNILDHIYDDKSRYKIDSEKNSIIKPSAKEQQIILFYFNLYTDNIDGINGPNLEKAIEDYVKINESKSDRSEEVQEIYSLEDYVKFMRILLGALNTDKMTVIGDYDTIDISVIQYYLSRLGLYQGDINGVYNFETRNAVLKFEGQIGMPHNVALSTELFHNLYVMFTLCYSKDILNSYPYVFF